MNDELANDRTYLAWLRTGIALFGLGFVVAKVALIVRRGTLRVEDQDLYSVAGILLILCGAALIVVGYLQHARLAKLLRRSDEPRVPRWPFTITAVAVISALLLSVLIIVST